MRWTTAAVVLFGTPLLLLPKPAASQAETRVAEPTAQWEWDPPFVIPTTATDYLGPSLAPLHGTEERSGWRKGLVIGGLIGAGIGLAAFLVVDSFGCDSCVGVSESFADGAGPEFVLGLGLVGAAIGALVGR